MQKENQRVTLTKRLLKEGLLQLLESKNLEQINISELCRVSGINRATFYKHYMSPRDVLLDIGKDVLTDLMELSTEPPSLTSTKKHLERICIYLKEHSDLMKVLIRCNTDLTLVHLINELSQSIWEQNAVTGNLNTFDEESTRLISTFLGAGGYYLLRQWLIEDSTKTPAEITELIWGIISADYFFQN